MHITKSGDKRVFLGHPLHPIPLKNSAPRTVKVSSFMELDLVKFLEDYAVGMGARSTSEVIRRLVIIGAIAEGYTFEDDSPTTDRQTA